MKYLLSFFLFISVCTVIGQTVYKTPSGKKYHTATCRHVKNVSEGLSISDAKARGLPPCLVCNPNQSSSHSTSSNTGLGIKKGEAKGTRDVSVQCKGVTKKGARCKRMTKNVNSYCFQHES